MPSVFFGGCLVAVSRLGNTMRWSVMEVRLHTSRTAGSAEDRYRHEIAGC
jgi:hypothetical protein